MCNFRMFKKEKHKSVDQRLKEILDLVQSLAKPELEAHIKAVIETTKAEQCGQAHFGMAFGAND